MTSIVSHERFFVTVYNFMKSFYGCIITIMNQPMWKRYLSYRQTAEAQASLPIRARAFAVRSLEKLNKWKLHTKSHISDYIEWLCIVCLKEFKLSHLMKLWYFLSSVNSFFKRACSGAKCLISGRTLRLLPYFMCANSEGSGETAWMRRLAWAFTSRLCEKYHNVMSWLSCTTLRSLFLMRWLNFHSYRLTPMMCWTLV